MQSKKILAWLAKYSGLTALLMYLLPCLAIVVGVRSAIKYVIML